MLGLLCSALAFLLFFRLIAEIGPGRATVITYINPVVALALGVAVLDESVTTGVVVGLLLILAGSWLSTDGRLPPGLASLAERARGRAAARGSEAPGWLTAAVLRSGDDAAGELGIGFGARGVLPYQGKP